MGPGNIYASVKGQINDVTAKYFLTLKYGVEPRALSSAYFFIFFFFLGGGEENDDFYVRVIFVISFIFSFLSFISR